MFSAPFFFEGNLICFEAAAVSKAKAKLALAALRPSVEAAVKAKAKATARGTFFSCHVVLTWGSSGDKLREICAYEAGGNSSSSSSNDRA